MALLAAPAGAPADVTFDYEAKIVGNGKPQGELRGPFGLATNSQGKLYVTEHAANRIQVFSSYEEGNMPASTFGSPGPELGHLNDPLGVAIGTSGDLVKDGVFTNDSVEDAVYVADWGNDRVQEFGPLWQGSTSLGSFVLPPGPGGNGDDGGPLGIAEREPGEVYVSTMIDGGEIGYVDLVESPALTDPPKIAAVKSAVEVEPFSFPASIAVDAAGRLYVVDFIREEVRVHAPPEEGNKLLRTFGGHGIAPGKFSYPWGVATDALGRVYVSEMGAFGGAGRLQIFSSYEEGNDPVATFSAVPDDTNDLALHLTGVTVDGTRVYIADLACAPELGFCNPASTDAVWRLRFDDADADGVFDSIEPKPPASPSGEASPGPPQPDADTTAPFSRVTQPRGKRASAWRKRRGGSKRGARSLRQIAGYAVDGESGVAKVEIAIVKRAKVRCSALARSGLRRSSCSKPRFLGASMLDSPSNGAKQRWRVRLNRRQQRALVAGRYEVISRATDLAGNVEQALRGARNFKRLKLS